MEYVSHHFNQNVRLPPVRQEPYTSMRFFFVELIKHAMDWLHSIVIMLFIRVLFTKAVMLHEKTI
jgi:hypothetical protein